MDEPREMLNAQAQRALRMLRGVWAALLGGQAALGLAVAGLMAADRAGGRPGLFPLLFYVSAGWLVVAGPMGYFVRNQVYKANWLGHAVTPGGYVRGNLVLLAVLAGASLLGLAAVAATGRAWPTAAVVAGALLLQAVNFPTGKPMTSTPPGFVTERGRA